MTPVTTTNKQQLLLLLTLLLVLNNAVTIVNANFFSRVLKSRDEREEKPAPSGAINAKGPEGKLGTYVTYRNGIPMARLSNNNEIPLVGYGVGNLDHEHVTEMVSAAIQDHRKTRLIDTAHRSDNEYLVAQGILDGLDKLETDIGDIQEAIDIHITTKVWYTHLGYERTKLAVQESLENLQELQDDPRVNLKLHVQLHWPRCFDNIPWMDCDAEEAQLPDYVKETGPDPRQDHFAWKASWRALEDLYFSEDYPSITSIGVSNFHWQEIHAMEDFARIFPHIFQINIWTLMHDSTMVEYCHKRRVHLQVYNAMEGTVVQPDTAPNAFTYIIKVAHDLSLEFNTQLTPGQVILAWLVQHGITVIPKTTKYYRLDENSAYSIARIPGFNNHQVDLIAKAVEAYIRKDDMDEAIHINVTFHATNKDIMLYYMDEFDEEEHLAYLLKGQSFTDNTYPNHRFRIYDASNRDVFVEHTVTGRFGDHNHIHVEL